MAAAGIDLATLAAFYGIPHGTLSRWAHEQSWPVVQKRSQRLGLPQLYDLDAIRARSGERLEQRMRQQAA